MPRISVVMPVLNVSPFVEEAVRSVLGQTYRDLELIVVDDGSTDRTADVVEAIPDERIRLVRAEHEGYVPATLRGLSLAGGELIARADGDDVYLPELFQRQIDLLDAHPGTAAVGSWVRQFGGRQMCWHLPVEPHEIRRFLRYGCALTQPVMMRADAYRAVGGLRAVRWEDWDLWIRMAHRYELRNVPEFLVLRRFRPESVYHSPDRIERRRANLRARLTAARLLGLDSHSAFVLARNLVSLPVYRLVDGFLSPMREPPPTLETAPSVSVVLLTDARDAEDGAARLGLDSADEVIGPLGAGERDALGAGMRAARGDLIAYLSAGAVPGPDWIAEIKRSFLDPSVGVAGGPSAGLEAVDCYADVSRLVGPGVAFRRELLEPHAEGAASLAELQTAACEEARRRGYRVLFTRWAVVEPAGSVSVRS